MRVRFDKNADETLKENEKYIKEDDDVKGKWRKIFNNDNLIHLEIGMGKGNFILNMAKQFPDINFIGIERNRTILAKAVKKIEKEGIENIRVMSNDADELENIFDSGELDKLYLNFSDPWPKNKHYKRRLTYREYLNKYSNILKQGALIEFKTDNQLLFEFTILEVCNTSRTMEYISLDLHNAEEFNIMTEYEEKFSKKGNRIYKLVWKN